MKLIQIIVLLMISTGAYSDNSKPIKALAENMCNIFTGSGLKIASDAKIAIQSYMERFENKANPTGTEMLQFLNKNRHEMTCKARDGVEKNYMKYALTEEPQVDCLKNSLLMT